MGSKKVKKLWGVFDTRPLIWFHYLLLVFAIIFIENLEIDLDFLNLPWPGLILLAIALSVLYIGIVDQVIHKVLGVD